MYVTIKTDEDRRSTVHSITVDGKEMIPENTYTALLHKLMHSGGKNHSSEEVANRIIKISEQEKISEEEWAKELERKEEERKKIQEGRVEYGEMMNEKYGKNSKNI